MMNTITPNSAMIAPNAVSPVNVQYVCPYRTYMPVPAIETARPMIIKNIPPSNNVARSLFVVVSDILTPTMCTDVITINRLISSLKVLRESTPT